MREEKQEMTQKLSPGVTVAPLELCSEVTLSQADPMPREPGRGLNPWGGPAGHWKAGSSPLLRAGVQLCVGQASINNKPDLRIFI